MHADQTCQLSALRKFSCSVQQFDSSLCVTSHVLEEAPVRLSIPMLTADNDLNGVLKKKKGVDSVYVRL